METLRNISLRAFNTLALEARADCLYRVQDEAELEALVDQLEDARQLRVIGQGSNTVFSRDIHEPLVQLQLNGIQTRDEGDTERVDVGAGLAWQALVDWACARGLAGLENLNRIPGSVGAAPVQNIGAYGVELDHCFIALHGYDVLERRWHTLDKTACEFGYRDSVFKHRLCDRFIITQVSLRLKKQFQPILDYPALREYFAGKPAPDLQAVAQAVAAIRASKLPDPVSLPNAGSFFKNPVISAAQYQHLQAAYADMPGYPQADGRIKVPAAWLLDRAGWKGQRDGALGMHAQQALVMVNYGHATGADVLAFAHRMQTDIQQRFGIELVIEPRVY